MMMMMQGSHSAAVRVRGELRPPGVVRNGPRRRCGRPARARKAAAATTAGRDWLAGWLAALQARRCAAATRPRRPRARAPVAVVRRPVRARAPYLRGVGRGMSCSRRVGLGLRSRCPRGGRALPGRLRRQGPLRWLRLLQVRRGARRARAPASSARRAHPPQPGVGLCGAASAGILRHGLPPDREQSNPQARRYDRFVGPACAAPLRHMGAEAAARYPACSSCALCARRFVVDGLTPSVALLRARGRAAN
eukprot:scaffold1326_cov296-Prasinococcus_capsulatus_cf.AAC.6